MIDPHAADNLSEFDSMTNASDANLNCESATVPTVRQSTYTAVLRGKSRANGVGLVEVYELP